MEENSITTSFEEEFIMLLKSYRIYGFKSRRELIETALLDFRDNYEKNVIQEMFQNVLFNRMLDNLKVFEKHVILASENIISLDYLFDILFYKGGFNDKLQENPDQLTIEIEQSRVQTLHKMMDIIQNVNGGMKDDR
ncbi:hypothetical protein KHQ81_15385 (plasmid) [Mycoplasmatota bacterium]|nr:hypothetical protein KHQ81_15385 [Mycoplasmatota bacterium]